MSIPAKNNLVFPENSKGKISLSEIHLLLNEFKGMKNFHKTKDFDPNDYVDQLFTFLNEHLIKGRSFLKKNRIEPLTPWLESLGDIVHSFNNFLDSEKGYAPSTRRNTIRNLKRFKEFLAEAADKEGTIGEDISIFSLKDVLNYENYLIKRLNNGDIQQCTVYKYLYVVELFVDFLKLNFHYNVPPSLKGHGNRTNAYATTPDIINLIETAEQNSSFKLRDISILLLIMELGCRPIEITGLSINDLRLSECLITLYSVKSGQRTLKISKDLTKLIQKYIDVRNKFNPQHESLFINIFGEPFSRNGISTMIYNFNKKAFGVAKINAKCLRHTYATNALDNLNDFDEVSKTMGHLHWVSTEYYVHKSVKRLLKNSLPFNPLDQLS